MNICFVDKTDFQYDSNSIYSPNLRGAETILINLSNSLSQLGHKVTVINNCKENKVINGVRWLNFNSVKKQEKFDLLVSNGDCRLLKYGKSENNILFSHSLQSIEKFIRKKQLISFLKYKPKLCFLSEYHKKNRSKLLTLFGHIDLRWSIDDIFINEKLDENIDKDLAIFTSRPDRNLELLIDIWTKYIVTKKNTLKLLVTNNNFNILESSIIKRELGDQRDLIKDLKKSRVCLIPGHKAELFCLAAEEARELCIPIVTLGIGCLKERVEHGVTGYIAKNKEEFSNYTLELFNDDIKWNLFRNNLIKKRSLRTWEKVAGDLINQIG